MKAVKPTWNGKTFTMTVLENVQDVATAAFAGYVVFENNADAIVMIRSGRLVPSWSEKKRAALLTFLENN